MLKWKLVKKNINQVLTSRKKQKKLDCMKIFGENIKSLKKIAIWK